MALHELPPSMGSRRAKGRLLSVTGAGEDRVSMSSIAWEPIPRQRTTIHGVGYVSDSVRGLHAPMAVQRGYAAMRRACPVTDGLSVALIGLMVAAVSVAGQWASGRWG